MTHDCTDIWSLVYHYLNPISPYLQQDGVTEICVNRFNQIFIECDGSIQTVDVVFNTENHILQLVLQIAHSLGQPCDPVTHPILDARLPDGSRICAVLYPTAVNGTCLTIRVAPKIRFTPTMLCERGVLDEAMLDYLQDAIQQRANCIISGGTGSGKTTLLSALAHFIPEQDRVITVEDTRELLVPVHNWIALEAPQKKLESHDQQCIDMAALIKTTLRMKPDRILVGEIRDCAAAMAFLFAINTGHRGTCTTLHANHPLDAINRIQTLVASQGSLPFDTTRHLVLANVNILVHVEHIRGTGRRITHIAECRNGEVQMRWERQGASHGW